MSTRKMVCAVMAVLILVGPAAAREEIGSLVFKAMKKIEDRHQRFLAEIAEVRAARADAVSQKNLVRGKYLKAKEGTIDQRELHADFSYQLARVFRTTYDELTFVKSAARDHLQTLGPLQEALERGRETLHAEATKRIISTTKGFLISSKDLLTSLTEYREYITDPVVNSKLNVAASTVQSIEDFLASLSVNRLDTSSIQDRLQKQISGLIDQLNGLYVQSDVLIGLIRDKVQILKLVNQTAASELAMFSLSGGKAVIDDLSRSILDPLKDILRESDHDLDIVVTGAPSHPEVDSQRPQGWVQTAKRLRDYRKER